MHEFSIAIQLLERVLQVAAQNGAVRVVRVAVETGSLQAVVPDALQLTFEAAAKGTLAETAELEVIEVASIAACRGCSTQFEPSVADYTCPKCGKADAEIVNGRGVLIKALEVITDDEDSGERNNAETN